MLNSEKIYVFNKTKFLKKGDHSDYWYRIEYLYKDGKGNIQYNYEFVSLEDFEQVVCSFSSDLLQDLPAYVFKGHYQNFKFKADILVE